MYRRRDQIVQAKDLKGGLCAASWFLGKDVKSVITCQATPGSKLAEKIRKEIGESPDGSCSIVMEEGGVPLTLGLKKTDPCPTDGCQFGDRECWVEGNKCSSMGSIYCITCNTCKQVLDPEIREVPSISGGIKSAHYIGMSATSLHNRHKSHREGHQAGLKTNVMVKHDKDCHGGIVQDYTVKLVQTERSLLYLSIREALLIEGQIYGSSLNYRHENRRGTGMIRINPGRAGVT